LDEDGSGQEDIPAARQFTSAEIVRNLIPSILLKYALLINMKSNMVLKLCAATVVGLVHGGTFNNALPFCVIGTKPASECVCVCVCTPHPSSSSRLG
jgi:hypothetical protein